MRRAAVLIVCAVVACSPPGGGGSTSAASPSPVAPTPARALSAGGIVEYPIPKPPKTPSDCGPRCPAAIADLALGPDGNIWFEDNNRKVIGRITPTGDVKQFSEAYELIGGANTIVAGPDGNVWVVAGGGGRGKPDWILRVTPAGQITPFSAGDNLGGGLGSGPESITLGPDGNLWFDEFWTNRIGRLTPSGSLTEFAIPTADSGPRGITAGPDGNVWFAESGRARPAIGRITPKGVVTEFPLTDGPADLSPYSIVAGPDGNLWFTDSSGVAHISPSGHVVPVPLPQGSAPGYLVSAPDGNLWFGDRQRDMIVRLGITGAIREFPLPHRGSWAGSLAVGADGRIWFAESSMPAIASIGVKVPEVLMSRRPLVFADASAYTVSIRNTGDAALAISGVQITGVDRTQFIAGADTCVAASLAPDASCRIQLSHVAGGPAGIQSALLEISDNATASPQRLSLVAQVPQCTLPVVSLNADGSTGAGEQLDVRSAQVLYDRSGVIPNARYFDRPMGRWLPVPGPQNVSPDGTRYVYFPATQGPPPGEIRVVDLVSGSEKALKLPAGWWLVVGFTSQGVYMHQAYEVPSPGLTLLDPDTGTLKTVFTDLVADRVDGTTAWLEARNPADKLPNPSPMGVGGNEIMKRDLVTGQTVTWLYRPGTDVGVAAIVNGSPVIAVYDGTTTTYWLASTVNQGQTMTFPFDSEIYPSVRGFSGDAAGVWVGSPDGVYLWTPRTGSVLVTEVAAVPAGTCA